LAPTLTRDIVFSAIQLPLFEYFRNKNYLKLSSVYSAALSGALAAAIAGFVSCPLDVLKTRLMTQDFKIESAKNMVRKIYN
jgi:solute carrier family 25 S-adenosylmethionine transporter 26